MAGRAKKRMIRASEIGAFTYCRRAWWLKQVAGFDQQGRERALEQGIAAHARHGRSVRRSRWQRQAALWMLAGGLVLVGVALGLLLLPR